MKYRRLGRTRLKVSEIGFGCWAIGGTSYGPTNDDDSMAALETGWQSGINFFDTADTYGHGHSEELLGKFLEHKNRSEIFIASKVGWDFYHGGSKKNFDPEYIRFACDQSLNRLKTDYVDLYQLHNPSLEKIKSGEAVAILDGLKKKGKIRFIGISIHQEAEAFAAMEDPRVDVLQAPFNLIDQRMAENVFREAKLKQIGILAREPLACGLLTGKYNADHQFDKTDHRRRWTKEKLAVDMEKIQTLKKILATERLSLVQAALEFVLDFDAVGCVIPGAKTREQVLENIRASKDPKLRSEESYDLRQLYLREEIFKK